MAKYYTSRGTLRAYYLASIICIASFMQGYDAGVAGGVLSMASFQRDYHYFKKQRTSINALSVGLQNVGAFLSTFIAFPLTRRFGRRWAVMTAAFVFCIGASIEVADSHSLPAWYIGRFIAGVGQGGCSIVVPIYSAEMAPKAIRSKIGSMYQWFFTIGICPGVSSKSTGSVGLALVYWALGALMAVAGFGTYLELASYFPSRSGSEVVYLEQAYPRPRYFFSIAFAVQSVILSFRSSNAVVLSRYVWRIADKVPTDWEMKGVAIAAYTAAVICVIVHNRYSLWAVNVFGALKIATLVFISITGFVVLGGNVSRVVDPGANFSAAFKGTTNNGNDLSSALVSIVFAYSGYQNAFNVVNEVKDPLRTIKKHGVISVAIVAVLYMLCNVAYFSAVDKEAFGQSKEIAAAVFFTQVFGPGAAETVLNVLVLLSAYGNLLAVLIGQSRMIREIGRQGVLPGTSFWVSTKPFGTPIGPYALKWAMTFLMLVAPPAGDAFQFVVDLQTYPNSMFVFAMAIGVFILRRRRKKSNIPRSQFQVWDVLLIFFTLIQVFILVMPWWPPKVGPYAGDVSFWYATYCVVGIGIMVLCGLYYVAWMFVLPNWLGYRIRTEVVKAGDETTATHTLVKVPVADVREWDEQHTESGELPSSRAQTVSYDTETKAM